MLNKSTCSGSKKVCSSLFCWTTGCGVKVLQCLMSDRRYISTAKAWTLVSSIHSKYYRIFTVFAEVDYANHPMPKVFSKSINFHFMDWLLFYLIKCKFIITSNKQFKVRFLDDSELTEFLLLVTEYRKQRFTFWKKSCLFRKKSLPLRLADCSALLT